MPISTRVSRLLAAIAALIAGVVPHAVAQETKGAPIVQREVFAEHPTINVVNTIMRVKRDGLDGVLIVGSGNASMSCFVPDGGTASCAALKLTSVDAAQLVGSHDGDATSLLVHGLWGNRPLLSSTATARWSGDTTRSSPPWDTSRSWRARAARRR